MNPWTESINFNMPHYRVFADSFFSTAVWENEGKFLLIFWIIVIIAAGALFLHGTTPPARSMRNKFSLFALILIGASTLCTVIFSFFIVDLVNQNVAKNNIAEKYETSNLKFLNYDAESQTFKARYTAETYNINEELTFAFVNNNQEPFLIKLNNSDKNFQIIEKVIAKPIPKLIPISHIK